MTLIEIDVVRTVRRFLVNEQTPRWKSRDQASYIFVPNNNYDPIEP